MQVAEVLVCCSKQELCAGRGTACSPQEAAACICLHASLQHALRQQALLQAGRCHAKAESPMGSVSSATGLGDVQLCTQGLRELSGPSRSAGK